jgi:hypothetical protein
MTQEILDDEDLMGKELAALRNDRTSPDESVVVMEQAEVPQPVEPVAEEPVAETTSPEPAPEQPQAEHTDPVKTLEQVNAELQIARSEIGRVNALNRKYNEATREAAALREQLAQLQAAKAAQPESPSETASKLAAIADQVKDFPELAGIVAAVSDALQEADKKTAEVARQAAAQVVAPLEPLRREQESRIEVEQKAASDAALKQFNDTYPTAVEVVKSDDFKSWLGNQPSHIQYAFYKGQTPQDALSVMDTYDMHLRRSGLNPIAKLNPQQEPAVQQRSAPDTSRLQRAAGIPSRPTGSQGGQPPSDDFEASLAYFRQKRLAQARAAA